METHGGITKENVMSKGKWKPEGQRRTQEGKDIWTTGHETVFIDGLGTYSLSRMSRLEMLKNYLAALSLPGPMKGMDKKYLKNYVKYSIAMEEAHPTKKSGSRDRLQCILEEA